MQGQRDVSAWEVAGPHGQETDGKDGLVVITLILAAMDFQPSYTQQDEPDWEKKGEKATWCGTGSLRGEQAAADSQHINS